MITLQQALESTEFHYGNCTRAIGPRGGVKVQSIVYRKNGATKTWKTRPTHFRVPIKRGMYEYGDITHDRANEWHTPEDCPLNKQPDGAVSDIEHHTRIQEVRVPILSTPFWRLVCTCGHAGEERIHKANAEDDKLFHETAVVRGELPGKLGKEVK